MGWLFWSTTTEAGSLVDIITDDSGDLTATSGGDSKLKINTMDLE